MAGLFTVFVPPGVYTRTLTEEAVASLLGGLRIPVLIGVGEDTFTVKNEQVARGSSALADQIIADEDVSSQVAGTDVVFTVLNFPIVTKEGVGRTSSSPSDVVVKVDGEPVPVVRVDGSIGEVTLQQIPPVGATVLVTYYYNRRDTFISEEVLNDQITGTNTVFYTNFTPIVDGTDQGRLTNDPTRVTVLLNGTEIVPSVIDGLTGTITLASAPAITDDLVISYYYNNWAEDGDFLANKDVNSIISVGRSPGRSDFIDGVDFVLDGNQIKWGAAYRIRSGVHTPTFPVFDDTFITNVTMVDNKVYRRVATPAAVSAGNKDFILEFFPKDGSGKDIDADKSPGGTDPNSVVKAYVGTTPDTATLVDIVSVRGSEKKITLKTAPGLGVNVYVDYYMSVLPDDSFEVINTVSGGTGVGKYKVKSVNNRSYMATVVDGTQVVADPDFGTEGISWPNDFPDIQAMPGASRVTETVTLTFTSATNYTVSSSDLTRGSVGGTGVIGQTYIDARSGLRFTIMPGTLVTYAAADTLEFDITYGGDEFDVSATPNIQIPGIQFTLPTTTGLNPTNSAYIDLFDKEGQEPLVGEVYYITYSVNKDFTAGPKLYTKFKDVVNDIGEVSVENRLSLAAYLCFLNGAVAIACKQLKRDASGTDALASDYIDALTELEKPLPGGLRTAIVVPITTDESVLSVAKAHVEKMSSEIYQSERILFRGIAAGTDPLDAIEVVKNTKSPRVAMVYPDTWIIGLSDELNNETEYILDSSFAAAALAGVNVSPVYDVATPMTRKSVTGFKRLGRILDRPFESESLNSGMILCRDQAPNIIVVGAFTTDPTTVFTREIYIQTIIDETQQSMRARLDSFIGRKILNGLLQDIKAATAAMFEELIRAEIITDYTGIQASQVDEDPTIVNVEAYYRPVFGVNWIRVTLNVRTRL